MVAVFTDTDGLLIIVINGLVTEVGSVSHGAVVAREYSLPLIANIPLPPNTSKQEFPSVDGNTGELRILDKDY